MGFLIVFLTFCHLSTCHGAKMRWSQEMREQYSKRHFLELAHELTLHDQRNLARQIELQQRDLASCHSVKQGSGGSESVIKCMEFLNRESEMGLFSPQSQSLSQDLSILCEHLIEDPQMLSKLLNTKVLRSNPEHWKKCVKAAWQQVYLTVYANFEAHPVKALATVRQAERSLPSENHWSLKTRKLFEKNLKTWPGS